MILYQIQNNLTGKKLLHAWQGHGNWGNAGAYWRKAETVQRHLKHLLHDYERYEEQKKWGIDIGMRAVRFKTELAPQISIIATEMHTIGASKAYQVSDFIDIEVK